MALDPSVELAAMQDIIGGGAALPPMGAADASGQAVTCQFCTSLIDPTTGAVIQPPADAAGQDPLAALPEI